MERYILFKILMNLPKIGISAIGYQCSEHLDKVLEPWIDFNKKHNNIIISVSHGLFPETEKLGFPIKSTDDTIEKLEAYLDKNLIDQFIFLETPTFEKDIRNSTLPFLLAKDIDYLLLLDLQDEIYTEKNIIDICDFITRENFISFFKINFKNYVIDNYSYVDDFIAPRIWNNKLNGGIKQFYYDNEILFNNGKKADDTSCRIIPRNIAFVKHLSWVGSKDYLKRKIEFQKIHYGHCSYEWNEKSNKLELNEEFYLKYNLPKPILHKD